MTDMDKIVERAVYEAYHSWAAMPNRDAYVRQSMAHAAAVAAAHMTAATTRAIEARVRAEVAEEIARKIEADCAKFHSGQVCDCYDFVKVARAAAGSSRDTTPEPLKVKLYTHWLPFSVAAENQPFTDGQRRALAGHEDHETAGNWSAFGWRELRCVSCDVTVWSVTTPEGS